MNHTPSSSEGWLRNSWACKRIAKLLRRCANLLDPPLAAQPIVIDVGSALTVTEQKLYKTIGTELAASNAGRDPAKCNLIFGQHYTYGFLLPCNAIGLSSRAALVGDALIKSVIDQEKSLVTEFHKGGLFHDAALAHFLCGNIDKYEYLLAMAAEEDVKTSGNTRENLNLQKDALTGQTITEQLRCACGLLDGKIAGHAAGYTFMTGQSTVTVSQLDIWRQQLRSLDQFEFLRCVHDFHAFLGFEYPDYEAVKDNPFVMLRLVKALSHLAQWVESCLTDWQGGAIHGTLSTKLKTDPQFGGVLSAAAGGTEQFAGNNPFNHGGPAAVDAELQQLLLDLVNAPVGPQRKWRLLRILYIVRNSTAHNIEPNLQMYTNRTLLLNLLQAVFTSVFVICQLKGKQMPN
jgi:hypothetical protein